MGEKITRLGNLTAIFFPCNSGRSETSLPSFYDYVAACLSHVK